jgi:two-component system OmpR family response regulator
MSASVLLIEGEELIGTMVRMNLEDAGFRVVWVETAEESGEKYDVIFLDLDYCGEDGIQALKELRRRGVEAPVLAVTASVDTQTKVDALEQGADGYLQKPFEVPEMIARINAIIRRLND